MGQKWQKTLAVMSGPRHGSGGDCLDPATVGQVDASAFAIRQRWGRGPPRQTILRVRCTIVRSQVQKTFN